MTAQPFSFPWKPHKLDELGFVGRGRSRHRPRNDPVLYGGDVPFIQTGDVKEAELYLYRYGQTYNEMGLAQSKLWQPGTLCITIAANIAETAILAISGCFPDSVVGFVPDQEKSDAKFIKYYIDTIKLGMQGVSRGTTQDNLSLDKLLSFDFIVPEVEEQHRIASILSAYDDLIENNTRRIAILEEMARALYQEWFVHFRFPGHEHVPLAPSPLGPIPEGWEVRAASEVLEVNPKIRSDKKALKAFVPMSGLSDHSMLVSGVQIKETNSGARFQNGDTLLARITPCLENGKTGYVDFLPLDSDVAHGSTEFIVLRGRAVCPEFVYLLARSDGFRDHAIKSMSGATGRQRVRNECFNTFYLAEPDQETMARFRIIVEPMFQAVLLFAKKNENLRATRDLLLPKLISGEIAVSALPEEPIAEAAD